MQQGQKVKNPFNANNGIYNGGEALNMCQIPK